MSAILIRGGRVIDPSSGRDEQGNVLIEDGRVTAVGGGLDAESAEVVDTAGCIVTPGFVDLHAHLREPGFEQKGTIATETEAALLGGSRRSARCRTRTRRPTVRPRSRHC